jgi:cell wall-associated NlpC family hydrolase
MASGRSRMRGSWFVRSSGASSDASGGAEHPARGLERAHGGGRAALLTEARGSLIAAGCVLAVVAALCAGLLFCLSPAPAQAIPTELQSAYLYGDAKTQVDDLTVQAGYVQAEIDALDAELEGYTESFNQLQLQLTDVNQQMTTLRRELKTAEADHAYRVQKYEARICALYKSGGSGDELLTLLLACDGFDDLIQGVRLIATLADQDQRVVDNLSESTDQLNTLLANIDEKKAEELAIRKQIDGQKVQIEAALAERETTLANLDTEIVSIIVAEQKRQQQEKTRLTAALAAMLNGGQIYSGPLPQSDSEIVNQFLETAAYYIGIPYVWAGDRPSTGFDCSGFTQFVYAQHGVDLPHYSGYQAEMGLPVSYDQMQPGDLVAFGFPVHHVGIYIGDGLFIHAPRTGDVIRISYLSEKPNLSAIRRFDLKPRTGAPAVW